MGDDQTFTIPTRLAYELHTLVARERMAVAYRLESLAPNQHVRRNEAQQRLNELNELHDLALAGRNEFTSMIVAQLGGES